MRKADFKPSFGQPPSFHRIQDQQQQHHNKLAQKNIRRWTSKLDETLSRNLEKLDKEYRIAYMTKLLTSPSVDQLS